MNLNRLNTRISISSPGLKKTKLIKLLNAHSIALCLRIAMLFGFIVVLIGKSRSGKTLIIERTTPGKVVCKVDGVANGTRPSLSISDLPKGRYSIDEIGFYDRDSLQATIQGSLERTFVLSFQNESDLRGFGLDKLLANRRRVTLTLT